VRSVWVCPRWRVPDEGNLSRESEPCCGAEWLETIERTCPVAFLKAAEGKSVRRAARYIYRESQSGGRRCEGVSRTPIRQEKSGQCGKRKGKEWGLDASAGVLHV